MKLTTKGRPRASKYADPVLGQRFGMLRYVGPATHKANCYGKFRSRVMVKCDCGITKPMDRNDLLSGRSQSCGCQRGKRSSVDPITTTPMYRMYRQAIEAGHVMCREWKDARAFCKFFQPMMATPHLRVRPVDTEKTLSPTNFVLYSM